MVGVSPKRLRSDPLYALRVGYAAERGIPFKEFLAWDEGDQEVALVWLAQKRGVHGGCGTHPDEWDPRRGGDPEAYHAAVLLCPGCQKIELARSDLEKKKSAGEHVHGAYVALRHGPEPPPRH